MVKSAGEIDREALAGFAKWKEQRSETVLSLALRSQNIKLEVKLNLQSYIFFFHNLISPSSKYPQSTRCSTVAQRPHASSRSAGMCPLFFPPPQNFRSGM